MVQHEGELGRTLRFDCISEVMKTCRLHWFVHVERNNGNNVGSFLNIVELVLGTSTSTNKDLG